jgi:3'-phosphoadenosine 5'-phosphosulfate sulfotransferase (PAPS reductase)/FAD synthetase
MDISNDLEQETKTIVVWFSCGAASAVAAKKTIEKYGNSHNILIVNNPVAEEHPDNLRFLKDIEKWLGIPIISAVNTEINTISAYDIWEKRKYMSGVKGAPCTMLLKKHARYQFESKHKIDWHVLGFTLEEQKRHDKFITVERENVLPILIDAKLTKKDCFKIIQSEGIKLPEIYNLGYPNANCIGCVKSSSPTYWNLVREKNPEVFIQRSEQSRRLNCRLVKVKGKRIFLDELSPDVKGGKIKSYECGIFCDTD